MHCVKPPPPPHHSTERPRTYDETLEEICQRAVFEVADNQSTAASPSVPTYTYTDWFSLVWPSRRCPDMHLRRGFCFCCAQGQNRKDSRANDPALSLHRVPRTPARPCSRAQVGARRPEENIYAIQRQNSRSTVESRDSRPRNRMRTLLS